MADFGWRVYHPHPSKPKFQVPKGAVDAHCHVFGPADFFPYASTRKYTPCDAPKQRLWALRDHLGFSRNVIVQASCHGADNRALVDALIDAKGLARGVATVDKNIDEEQINLLHRAGVRGVRFNFVKRLVDKLPFDALETICEKITPFGWHIVVYFEANELVDIREFLTSLPGDIVVDHMGRPDVSQSVHSSEFQDFVKLLQDNQNFWCKVSCPERITKQKSESYDDVVPYAKLIVENFPDQVLWGSDWPHPNMVSHTPDDGHLVDVIPRIATTETLQEKLLVANPMRLYWPEENFMKPQQGSDDEFK